MTKINSGLYSSDSVEWTTPQDLFDRLNDKFAFTLDPCSDNANFKCSKHFTVMENGLEQSWRGERVFMNPPYGREIIEWVAKADYEAREGALVVGLLPVRPDTEWWQSYVQGNADIRFIKGRLKFGCVKTSAPFPSAIAIWWGWPQWCGSFCI